eukprot:6476683-Amphidinium_carterae.1
MAWTGQPSAATGPYTAEQTQKCARLSGTVPRKKGFHSQPLTATRHLDELRRCDFPLLDLLTELGLSAQLSCVQNLHSNSIELGVPAQSFKQSGLGWPALLGPVRA